MKQPFNKTVSNAYLTGHAGQKASHSIHSTGSFHRVLSFKVSGSQNIAFVQQFLRTFCSPITSLPTNTTELKCTLTLHSESSLGEVDDQLRERYNLTPRECEILRRISHGKTNMQIAVDLNLTYNTVRNHLKNIYFKLGARNKTEASLIYFGHYNEITENL